MWLAHADSAFCLTLTKMAASFRREPIIILRRYEPVLRNIAPVLGRSVQCFSRCGALFGSVKRDAQCILQATVDGYRLEV